MLCVVTPSFALFRTFHATDPWKQIPFGHVPASTDRYRNPTVRLRARGKLTHHSHRSGQRRCDLRRPVESYSIES